MKEYLLIAKALYVSITNGAWEQAREVVGLGILLISTGPILAALRGAVCIGIGINIFASLWYFYKTKKSKYLLYILVNLFILVLLLKSK